MELAGKSVLVTGGAGFIGSHLVEALVARGCSVRVLVRYNALGRWGHLDGLQRTVRDAVEVVWGDVRAPYSVAAAVAGREVVFHLAALIGIPYSYVAPQSYVSVNVEGTLHVLEASRRAGVARIVHTSTSETYGTAQYTPIDERHPLQGQSPYSASKIGADKMAEAYHRSFGLPVITLRPFNTYGPRQSARAVIPTIITQALSGSLIRLGSLTPVRDLTYVEDTVRAFLAAAETDAAVGQVVHTGHGRAISVGELAQRILRIAGLEGQCRIVEEEARVRPPESEVLALISDPSRARALLGWEPRVPLDEGLARTIAFVRDHLQLFKTEIYNV